MGLSQNVNVCLCNNTRVSVIISGYWPTFTISFTPDCLRSMYKSIADGNVFARYALAPNVAADDTSKPRPSAVVCRQYRTSQWLPTLDSVQKHTVREQHYIYIAPQIAMPYGRHSFPMGHVRNIRSGTYPLAFEASYHSVKQGAQPFRRWALPFAQPSLRLPH